MMKGIDKRPTMNSVVSSLRERAKELQCLYSVEELLLDATKPLSESLRGIAEAIPPALQYSDLGQARILLGEDIYETEGFAMKPWDYRCPIIEQDQIVGLVCISYTEQLPLSDTGPFLRDEIKLVQTIAARIGHFLLYRKLRGMFESSTEPGRQEDGPSAEWIVAVDLLRKTDPNLLDRIARKMINLLVVTGCEEARELLVTYGSEVRLDRASGEINEPIQKTSRVALSHLVDETFKLAARTLSDAEILLRIQKWIHQDKSVYLVKPLIDSFASLGEISDAMRRYRHYRPEGAELSPASSNSLMASLLRRFFTEQLEFINVAKRYVDPEDIYEILDRLIYPAGSHGKLGGKSAGLFLGARILQKQRENVPDIGEVYTPNTWWLASDGLQEFVNFNNLEEVYEQKYKNVNEVRQEYPHIIQLFKSSYFPQEIVKGLSMALDDFGDKPLVVRSSSLLEDRLGSAFSGKYKSLFVANQGTKPERLAALVDAIAEVYASTFGPDPIEYRAERGLLDFNEQMGVMIQEVIGKRVGKYFLPAFAGVAFSNNEFRWSVRIRREDGLVRLVPGLGTRAVDRLTDDYPVLVAPGQPTLRVNVSPDEVERYSPKFADVINLEANRFETLDVTALIQQAGTSYPGVRDVVSLMRDGLLQRPMGLATDYAEETPVVTFEGLVSRTPFIKQIAAIQKTLAGALGTPVDIEFASDGEKLYLLQCRPQSSASEDAAAIIPPRVPAADVLFSANKFVSNGHVPDITHVVYVDPDRYNELRSYEELVAVGNAVSRLNQMLPKRQFILVGPGRWGSRGDIKLGVRVTYSDINNTAMLVEVARKKGSYVPDLSFGTHFFQDLVEARIRYLPLYPDEPGIQFNEQFLLASPNILAQLLPEFEHLEYVVHVLDIRQLSSGRILRVLMNAEEDKALAFLSVAGAHGDAAAVNEPRGVYHNTASSNIEEHWRWRLRMAERIGELMDADRLGVRALYVFGSTKNAMAGPGSDIDLLVHFQGTASERLALEAWLDGWSLSLAEMNYLKTGVRTEGLLDAHIITDDDIRRRTSYAVKIDAVTDAARPLRLGQGLRR
ncbi:MAG: nucleotidyltransferase domain-containing protein [Myxococcota bacterium]|nr:nucleotidyltransferase domain-containing protein [Myxococcota bacterium]